MQCRTIPEAFPKIGERPGLGHPLGLSFCLPQKTDLLLIIVGARRSLMIDCPAKETEYVIFRAK